MVHFSIYQPIGNLQSFFALLEKIYPRFTPQPLRDRHSEKFFAHAMCTLPIGAIHKEF